MRVLIACALAVSAALTACTAEDRPETVEWRGRALRDVRALGDLPDAIQSQLDVGRPGLDGVADRGRPFNVTDVVDASLPMRRLLVAGTDGEIWLVAVEHGGRVYSIDVSLFLPPEPGAKERWILLERPRTLREVVQQLSQKGPEG